MEYLASFLLHWGTCTINGPKRLYIFASLMFRNTGDVVELTSGWSDSWCRLSCWLESFESFLPSWSYLFSSRSSHSLFFPTMFLEIWSMMLRRGPQTTWNQLLTFLPVVFDLSLIILAQGNLFFFIGIYYADADKEILEWSISCRWKY